MKIFQQLSQKASHYQKELDHTEYVIDQLLTATKDEYGSGQSIESMEQHVIYKLRQFPFLKKDDLYPSMDTAILAIRGWLLAFGVVALILFSLCLQNSSEGVRLSPNDDEVLTHNVEQVNPDPSVFTGDVDYGR